MRARPPAPVGRTFTTFAHRESMLPIGSQRALFDIPEGVAYFNTAYNAPLLNASRERLLAVAGAKSRPWERTAGDFFADVETVRALSARLFGGDVDGYAVIPAASYGISTAARAIEPTLRPGDRIVVLDEDFPSNVLPWRRVARETGACVVTVPTPADHDWTSALLTEIGRGARVVAAFNCHWTNGALLDVVRLGEVCRAAGATLVLDATQSLGALALDLDAVRPDFVIAAGYKWLLAPYGFGIMYVAPRWRDARPLEEGWLARESSEDFTTLVHYVDRYRPGARRFDVGEASVTTLLPGAIAALEQIEAWGIAGVTATLAETTRRIAGQLQERGFRVLPAERRAPHIVGARLPDGFEGDVVGTLRRQQVYISQRGASLRLAPHLHITDDDIARLAMALDAVVR